ncbi:MAG TPA: glycosyl hydrolase family 18 protein [Egibacteraceae bacterium]|nr:glycosyl hydrolase family 18 protein [Egibacteraceae bacterium]
MISRTAACAVTAFLLVAVAAPAFSQPVDGPHVRPDGHVALAWLHGGSSDDHRAQVDAMPGVTVVAPTWFGLDGLDLGAVTGVGDPAFVAWAAQRGIAVWPQLGNRLDADLSEAVLSDAGRRARLVAEAAAAVERTGAGGIVVGFENLREATGPALTAFVGALRTALPGRVVAVTVAALSDTWSRGEWSAAYERRALGEVADYVVLAALDEHHDGRPDGPVAGLEWTLEVVEHLLRSVPDRKVLLAVPLYVRDWVVDARAPGGVALHATRGMDAMATHLDEVAATHTYDPVAGQRRYTYSDAVGRAHRVWQEDPPSLGRRVALATRYNLGGVAVWRGGLAGPHAWVAVSSALAADPRPAGAASGPPRLNRLVPAPRFADPPPQAAAGETQRPLDPARPQPAGTSWPAPVLAVVLLAAVTAGLVARIRLRGPGAPRA